MPFREFIILQGELLLVVHVRLWEVDVSFLSTLMESGSNTFLCWCNDENCMVNYFNKVHPKIRIMTCSIG